MGKVWLIASGKGGVGKSTLSAMLGTALAHRGQNVCIVDMDIGVSGIRTPLPGHSAFHAGSHGV